MHRRLVILSIATGLAALISTGQPGAGSVKLSGPGLILEWNIQNDRLALTQMQREDGKPLLEEM